MVGVWWSGAEEDVIPAGKAAEGFAAGFNVAGTGYPVIEAIRKHVYAAGDGEMEDESRVNSIYYNRGVVFGIITAEAPLETSCADHEGSRVVRFMRWDGVRWDIITDWMAPAPEAAKLVRSKYEQSALKYAKEKGITPRACAGG